MEELEKLLKENFKRYADVHVESIIDRISEIQEYDCLKDDWEENGKYLYGDLIFKIKYKNDYYVINCSQSKSGSYHTDYYYIEPDLNDIMTFEDYSKPKEIFNFNYKGQNIKIFENNTITVCENSFNTIENAIDYIINNNQQGEN